MPAVLIAFSTSDSFMWTFSCFHVVHMSLKFCLVVTHIAECRAVFIIHYYHLLESFCLKWAVCVCVCVCVCSKGFFGLHSPE